MMKITDVEKSFRADTLALIDEANEIIEEYTAAGFCLTLRQLYYQFVSRDLMANRQTEYKRLGSIIADSRNARLIDWDSIEDHTRNLNESPHWDSPADIITACAGQFRYDLWADQKHRPEVWVEKDALSGVFEDVCVRLDIPLFACKGYVSQSETWAAGRRMFRYVNGGQMPVVFHFGDHDPSGIDMTRDIEERLSLYSCGSVRVKRIALNRDQVDEYDPPPNPAKVTDSRFAAYQSEHGDESWELGALEPAVLAALVEDNVLDVCDMSLRKEAISRQSAVRRRLETLAEGWQDD